MKRIVFILGIMFVGVIALLESSSKQKRRLKFTPESKFEYDDVWWDN